MTGDHLLKMDNSLRLRQTRLIFSTMHVGGFKSWYDVGACAQTIDFQIWSPELFKEQIMLSSG